MKWSSPSARPPPTRLQPTGESTATPRAFAGSPGSGFPEMEAPLRFGPLVAIVLSYAPPNSIRLGYFGQRLAQQLAPAAQSRHDRPDRNRQDLCRFLIRKLLHVHQKHN